jgi:hypothetical protein
MSFAKASNHSFDLSAARPFFSFSLQLTVRHRSLRTRYASQRSRRHLHPRTCNIHPLPFRRILCLPSPWLRPLIGFYIHVDPVPCPYNRGWLSARRIPRAAFKRPARGDHHPRFNRAFAVAACDAGAAFAMVRFISFPSDRDFLLTFIKRRLRLPNSQHALQRTILTRSSTSHYCRSDSQHCWRHQ